MNNNKEIMRVALKRLDVVISEINMSTSTVATMGFAGVAHDLVTIIKLASGVEDIENKEAES